MPLTTLVLRGIFEYENRINYKIVRGWGCVEGVASDSGDESAQCRREEAIALKQNKHLRRRWGKS